MQVLVLGGYGLIGSGVVAALLTAGHEVTGLGRSVAAARRRWPAVTWLAGDLSVLTAPERWSGIVAGMDAVVNCAGVLQDSPRDDIRKIQRDAMIALFAASEKAGVRRFVQISAVGADPDAPTLFMSTKGEADASLQGPTLDWIQIRLRDRARRAVRDKTPLPDAYHRLYRVWFAFWFPAFAAVLAIVWLMLGRPNLPTPF